MSENSIDLNKDNPIFIVGAKRGGTTLLRRVIDAHPEITVPPPGWLFHYIYPYLYSYGDLHKSENLFELVTDCLSIPMIKEHWDIGLGAEEVVERCAEKSFRGVLHALTNAYIEKNNSGRIWGSKAPGEAFWIREMHQEFPASRFVFLIRDGRDVATDLTQTIWGPRSAYTSALNWRYHMEAILSARDALPPESYFELRYESFVRSPENSLRELCEFLNVDFAEEMIGHHKVNADNFVTSSYHAKTNNPITDKYVGIHKELPSDDQHAINAAAGDLLEKLGYGNGTTRDVSKWELLRNGDLDDHGGMMLRGGVEFMEELRQKREASFAAGRWGVDDRLEFLQKTS